MPMADDRASPPKAVGLSARGMRIAPRGSNALVALPFLPVDLNISPVQLPWGPVGFIVASIVGGFLILNGVGAVMAWRKGEHYQAPARDFIALVICVGFFAVVAYTFLGKLNEGGDILLGALIAAFSAVVALYFRQNDKEPPS